LLRLLAAGWIAAVAAAAAVVYGPGEGVWPATFFLFGPRWALLLPAAVLLPLALSDRRLLGTLAATLAVAAGPVSGFNLPWRRLVAGAPGLPRLRVATWNVGGGVTEPEILAFLDRAGADLLALQEWPGPPIAPPAGYRVEGTRGLVLLSRFPIAGVAERDPSDIWRLDGSGAVVRYTVETPLGLLSLTNVHLETPREGIEAILETGLAGVPILKAKNAQRELEARLARRWVDASPSALRVVAGDFNTPAESSIFREFWGGLADCHSEAGWGFGFTKRTRLIAMRIDHVLAGPGLACARARTGDRAGGDHAPVVAEIGRAASPPPANARGPAASP
jgi:endonuclease/exonuclease/phosphatase family metal-dependent hydrolase